MSANANDGALHFDYRNLLAKSIPTVVVVNTYERSYEGEGLAIGGQYGWVDDATRWHKECETYQRQPKQGGDDGYHQLHPRAVVSFHRRTRI